MKILVPMAGAGSRFQEHGFKNPKPLIDVNGVPMIARVIQNISFEADYIFLVQKRHMLDYPWLVDLLKTETNGRCTIIPVDSLTEGAACTALLVKELIDTNDDLLILNSDQLIGFNKHNFITTIKHTTLDGLVMFFEANHPKWSYVTFDQNAIVTEVAEKRVISKHATCGAYWYKHGSLFVQWAEQMISKNIRVNNEFYIAPTFNEGIAAGAKIGGFEVEEMHGLGTPEDLAKYLNSTNA